MAELLKAEKSVTELMVQEQRLCQFGGEYLKSSRSGFSFQIEYYYGSPRNCRSLGKLCPFFAELIPMILQWNHVIPGKKYLCRKLLNY